MVERLGEQGRATLLGLLAIVLWGSLIAVFRSVTEQLGVLRAGAWVNLVGGGVGLALMWFRAGQTRRRPGGNSRAYLLGCGALFVVYSVALYLAIHLADTRAQTVGVGLVNYLWPALTLVLAVPILGKRARWGLGPGLALALVGVYLGSVPGADFSWTTFRASLQANPVPYVLALSAAVSWGMFSNLSRRWGTPDGANGAPLFLLATGIVLAGASLIFPDGSEQPWTVRGAAELMYLAIFPKMLAYLFWDRAMRQGNVVLVGSASFFTPLISTLISCVYLGVAMSPSLWLACGLVTAGALLCRASVVDRPVTA